MIGSIKFKQGDTHVRILVADPIEVSFTGGELEVTAGLPVAVFEEGEIPVIYLHDVVSYNVATVADTVSAYPVPFVGKYATVTCMDSDHNRAQLSYKGYHFPSKHATSEKWAPQAQATKILSSIPGLNSHDYTRPSDCEFCVGRTLWNMVQHLNDVHRWTREQIATWLEEQAEQHGIDLSFPVPEEEL